MEFKHRAVDDRPKPTPTSFPSPSITYFPERSLQAGSSSVIPRPPITYRMPNMNNVDEAMQREREKEQIRREIIAAEIARRRELEEEVRRELMVERELAMRRNLAMEGLSFEERVIMGLNRVPPVSVVHPFDYCPLEERIAMPINVFPVPQPPQLMAPEIKPSPEPKKKDKVITLAKPDPELYGAKRKAETPAVDGSEQSLSGLNKKPKEDWRCALCKVSATSERGLNEHLEGKKHKAKEAALGTRKIGLVSQADKQSVQPDTTSDGMNQSVDDKGPEESKSEEQLVQKGEGNKKNALKIREVKFWCEICQVGTFSQTVMESHKKGRKHLNKMKTSSKNDGSAPPPWTLPSSEVPGLVKDIDAVNPEEIDQKLTYILNEETITKLEENSADSDKFSAVAESSENGAGEAL